MPEKKLEEPICSLDYAFRMIGGKYKGRILWYIYTENNALRFGELKKLLLNITSKMLTQSLRELERDQLISRKVYRQVPPKVEYSLTTIGQELMPFIENLRLWGEKQMQQNAD